MVIIYASPKGVCTKVKKHLEKVMAIDMGLCGIDPRHTIQK
jgi:hypothetical protein